jgi:hypothetical protein
MAKSAYEGTLNGPESENFSVEVHAPEPSQPPLFV